MTTLIQSIKFSPFIIKTPAENISPTTTGFNDDNAYFTNLLSLFLNSHNTTPTIIIIVGRQRANVAKQEPIIPAQVGDNKLLISLVLANEWLAVYPTYVAQFIDIGPGVI